MLFPQRGLLFPFLLCRFHLPKCYACNITLKVLLEKALPLKKMSSFKKKIANKNVVIVCIFEFRYIPSDEIFFINSKSNKSLNQKTKILFGIIYPFPKFLLDNKHIVKTINSPNNNIILFAKVVKMIHLKMSLQNVYQKHQK